MSTKVPQVAPEHTAVRVALWRALHLKCDDQPHVFVDEWGEKLAGEIGWRERPDMDPNFSRTMRASIVGRARFVEDLLDDSIKKDVSQYVILGAGLDTLSLRRPDLANQLTIFEVDQPDPQEWKRKRILELGLSFPKNLRMVPVNFELKESWREALLNAGFNSKKPAVVVSTGVSMYLTLEANHQLLQALSQFAPDSVFAMTFMMQLELLNPKERAVMEFVMKRAAESGTPFLSLFSPPDLLELAKSAGLSEREYVSAETIYQKYFASRTDGLRAGDAEAFLVARL